MIPWIVFAVVVAPLVVVAFVVTRRKTRSADVSLQLTAEPRARTEEEFAAAEAYEAKWHEADKERFQSERLP